MEVPLRAEDTDLGLGEEHVDEPEQRVDKRDEADDEHAHAPRPVLQPAAVRVPHGRQLLLARRVRHELQKFKNQHRKISPGPLRLGRSIWRSH